MWSWILEHWLSSLGGWLGTAGLFVIACVAVWYFFPPLRRLAIEIAAVAISVATIYAKGNRDRAKLEQDRKDAAVKDLTEKYDEIDKRPDGPDDVARRLRSHNF